MNIIDKRLSTMAELVERSLPHSRVVKVFLNPAVTVRQVIERLNNFLIPAPKTQ